MADRNIRFWAMALIALVPTLVHSRPAVATPLSVDGFAVSISEDVATFGNVSQSLLNSLILVAQDRPMISLVNTSTSTAEISAVSLTMGNSTFSFGSLILMPQSSSATVATFYPGDTPGLHAEAPFLSLTFGEFAANQTFNFRADIDHTADGGASLTNYRQALAGGPDSSQWATINVSFSDGQTLHELITPADISGRRRTPSTTTSIACAAYRRRARSRCRPKPLLPSPSRRLGCLPPWVPWAFRCSRPCDGAWPAASGASTSGAPRRSASWVNSARCSR